MNYSLILFLIVFAVVPLAAQPIPITPEWKVTRSVDKITDEVTCMLQSPLAEFADKENVDVKKWPVLTLWLSNGKWHIVSTVRPPFAYRNVLVRVDSNKAIDFAIVRTNVTAELEDKGKSALLINQLKNSKAILLRLGVSVEETYDLKISSTFFNDGYSKYKECLSKK